MGPKEDILAVVGNTPLVRLRRVAEGVQGAVYAKLEFMNPGGSVKDRIALHLVREAEESGRLRKGGTIIEPTSGNTGMALAMLAAVRGYKTIFTMPDKVSEEKRALLRALGAEVILTPTEAPPGSPQHYVSVARRLSEEVEGSYMPNQYANRGNPDAHYRSTGTERYGRRWTGGSARSSPASVQEEPSGTGRYLKEREPSIRGGGRRASRLAILQQKVRDRLPAPSVPGGRHRRGFRTGDIRPGCGGRDSPRLGPPEFHDGQEAREEEGILARGSSGAAVARALEFLKAREDVKNVVVILPDTGRSYLSKFYSDEWLKSKGIE